MRVHGIDVSWCQGPSIDWPAVAAGDTKFAFMKCTEGVNGGDATFDRNRKEAAAAGLLIGGYHYGHLEQSAEAQARRFWTRSGELGLNDGELPCVLDIEQRLPPAFTPASAIQWIADYLTAIKEMSGKTGILYTFPYYWQTATMGGGTIPDVIRDSILWIAQYSKTGPWTPGENDKPHVPLAWKDWTFWQYSGNGGERVAGIKTDCDRNLFNGSLQDLPLIGQPPQPLCESPPETCAPDDSGNPG